MKFILDQVEIAKQNIVLPKPIIQLMCRYGDYIAIELNNKLVLNEEITGKVDPLVIDAVRQNTSIKLNIRLKRYVMLINDKHVVDSILYTLEHSVLYFLQQHGGFSNNRLSKIYKWYREKITASTMKKNEKLAQDIYNIVKFMGDSSDRDTCKTVRSLLSLIKDRYEPIVGSLK
jgi:hypothetical protein